MQSAASDRTWAKEYPAPVMGLVTHRSLANQHPEQANRLDNYIPTQTGARVRLGKKLWATISGRVTAMFTFQSAAGTEKIFAADASSIYDITAPSSATETPTAAVTGMSGGYWAFEQMKTSGGDFLIGCNGEDTPREYDGTSWSASTMTGSGLTTSDLSFPWRFKNRMFFIEKDSMDFWYLSVGTKSGALTAYNMQGVFRGGSLLMGGTWSMDAGDGLSDYCVIISTLGQVAIYQGSNPSDANDWSLVGVYQITAPLGKNAFMRAGGDLIIATTEGMVPISEAVSKDSAALSLAAVSRSIEPDWKSRVSERGAYPWDVMRWDIKNYALVAMPNPGELDNLCYGVNLETGAWFRLTGWDPQCGAVLNNQLYFGEGDGKIYEAEKTGNDNGAAYTCAYVGAYLSPSRAIAEKVATVARAFFTATRNFAPKVSLSTDYNEVLPTEPAALSAILDHEWDAGLWDVAVWDGVTTFQLRLHWRSVSGVGETMAPQVQMTFNNPSDPDVELVKFQLKGYVGGMVV